MGFDGYVGRVSKVVISEAKVLDFMALDDYHWWSHLFVWPGKLHCAFGGLDQNH